jgi:hypothetical protein
MVTEYIVKLIEKHPQLRGGDNKMTLSVSEFLRHIQRAYEAGQEGERSKLQAAQDFEGIKTKPDPPDFLRDFFSL